FGAPRTTPSFAAVTSTDLTYTSQRDLPGTGLMDYKARFYSPALGRFTQPDTIIPGAANPQSWNRYSYVHNNPIRYNDPTGHWIVSAWDIANIVWDIAEVRKDPSALNIGALVIDVAALIMPAVPAGAGLIARGAKVVSKGDDVADAVKAAQNLVKYGDKAKDAKTWIGKILDVSVHNVESPHVVLGSYDDYIKYAQNAKTVNGKGHTYFDMPEKVWDVLKDGNSWKAVNKLFIYDQFDQGKKFLVKVAPDIEKLGKGLKLELKTLDKLDKYYKWLK
ncbi:MAG TPA: hypothetical protein DCX53_10900, partial [Anaerolineae bacterium]|nr:hypothetical protein [Anaerolineae bacterium]